MGYRKSYDLYKLNMIKKRKYSSANNEEFKNLVCGLSSDSDKMAILKEESYFEGFYPDIAIKIKIKIIESLQSDDAKICMINSLDELFDESETNNLIWSKKQIIISFASDKKKIEQFVNLYNKYGNNNVYRYIDEIIYSLSSDDFKMQLLDALGYSCDSVEAIASLNSDEMKEKYIRTKNPYYRSLILIKSLQSDDLKKEFLSDLFYQDKNEAIASLSEKCDDFKKERFYWLDHYGKLAVAKSYDSDQYKEDYIKELEEEWKKSYIRTHWLKETQEEMDEYLSSHPFDETTERDVAEIVATFKSNQLKLKYLNKMNLSRNKMLIISSLGYVKTERKAEDVLTSVEQLDENARNLFAKIAYIRYNNVLDIQEESGVKKWREMEEKRRELEKLVEENKATRKEMADKIKFFGFEEKQLLDPEPDCQR